MSLVAIDRMVDERTQEDPAYKAELEAVGHGLLRDARALDDDELTTRLAEIHGPVDRQHFAALTRDHDSAEGVANEIITRRDDPLDPLSENWLWYTLAILWERWQPERPSFEMLDAWMQEGYRLASEQQLSAACELWLRVWRTFTNICERRGIDSVHDLDCRFCGTQSVFNWMQDLELELWNAGLKEPGFLQERIGLCRDVLARFHDLDALTASNSKCAVAESLAKLGEVEAADAEFDALTLASPANASLWSLWARSFDPSDLAKAARIIERGLAAPGLIDRRRLLEDAVEIGGKAGHAELVRRARHELVSARQELAATAPRKGKIGRNDPCPCGSGRKYKKCCLGTAPA